MSDQIWGVTNLVSDHFCSVVIFTVVKMLALFTEAKWLINVSTQNCPNREAMSIDSILT